MLQGPITAVAVAIALFSTLGCSAVRTHSANGSSAAIQPQAEPLAWREFRDEGNTFTIQLPGEPKVTTSDISRDGHTATKYQASVMRERYSFTIATFELPEFGINREQYRQLIETSVTQAAESGKVRVVSKRSFDVNGFPAFELNGESSDGKQLLTLRRVAMDRRGYMFVVMRDHGAVPDADVKRFMDSFAMLKPN